MGFRCKICYESQEAGTPAESVVLEFRHRNYSKREYRRNKKKIEDPGGKGMEIVREVIACAGCKYSNDQASLDSRAVS